MCVILFTEINGKKIFAKNRDRIYKPSIVIKHEIINGIELVYMEDAKTGWIEGMNENGVAIINSTLNMKESSSKFLKKTRKIIMGKKKNIFQFDK